MKKYNPLRADNDVWTDILRFNTDMDSHLSTKANFLFGASTFILIFVMNKVFAQEFHVLYPLIKASWIILFAGSFAAFLTAMMIVLPRIRLFSSKKRVQDDVFYYKNIAKFHTRDSYNKILQDIPSNPDRMGPAYSNQIYSLATYVIPYKFKLLKISGWTLVFSVMLSTLLFVVSII